jgi:hypothetical protein
VVYLEACAHLAAAHAANGFHYAASKQHFSRVVPPFTYRIGFWSSPNNVAGEYVALWIYAGVQSVPLKRWRARAQHPLAEGGVVAGAQLGNLQEPKRWLEWNLADRAARPATLEDAAEAIRSIALPYFSRFVDVASLLDALTVSDVPEISNPCAIELSLSLGARPQAAAIGRRVLTERPDQREAYRETLARLHGQGFPKEPPSGGPQQLAWLSRAHDLDFGEREH